MPRDGTARGRRLCFSISWDAFPSKNKRSPLCMTDGCSSQPLPEAGRAGAPTVQTDKGLGVNATAPGEQGQ